MSKKLLITDLELNKKTVRLNGIADDGKLTDISCTNSDDELIVGNIYVGRIQKIEPSLNAAFIDIGPDQTAYYPIGKYCAPIYVKCLNQLKLVQGEEILVQIESAAVKTKLPTVTTNICLTGRYVVISSENKRIGYSTKLVGEEKSRIVKCLDFIDFKEFGIIFRTNCKEADNEQIIEEANHLIEKLASIISRGKTRTLYSCVYKNNENLFKYLKGTYCDGVEEIVTDIPEVYEEVSKYTKAYTGLKNINVRLYDDKSYSMAKLYNLNGQLEHATARRVWLKSGGYLVIDQTEALTVIDVNSGKSIKAKTPETSYLKINLEAAKEAAAQIRLRNISGIIIIDFIDLKKDSDKDELIKAMIQHVNNDPVHTKVIDFTRLNLMEITRKKVEKSLKEQLTGDVDYANI